MKNKRLIPLLAGAAVLASLIALATLLAPSRAYGKPVTLTSSRTGQFTSHSLVQSGRIQTRAYGRLQDSSTGPHPDTLPPGVRVHLPSYVRYDLKACREWWPAGSPRPAPGELWFMRCDSGVESITIAGP